MAVVFLLGGPGSGKGTECEILKREMGQQVEIVSLGEELRKEASKGDERALAIRSLMIEGKLLPSEWTMDVLRNSIARCMERGNLVVVDGFPRNMSNWDAWRQDPYLSSLCLGGVVLLRCDEETMLRRVVGRAGSRVDDNEETARKRIRGFFEETMQVVRAIEYCLDVVEIDGSRHKDAVHCEVVAYLRKIQGGLEGTE